MSKPKAKDEYPNFKELVDDGMKYVHQELRKEKLRKSEPLVVQEGDKVLLLDPLDMAVITEDHLDKDGFIKREYKRKGEEV